MNERGIILTQFSFIMLHSTSLCRKQAGTYLFNVFCALFVLEQMVFKLFYRLTEGKSISNSTQNAFKAP